MRKGTTSSQNNKEQQEKKSVSIKLNTQNPNHLLCGYGEVEFEILGGVIHDNYNSLRIMLLSKIDRFKLRESVDLYEANQVLKYQRKLSESTHTPIKEVQDAFFHLTDELEAYINELRENKGRPQATKQELSLSEKAEAEKLLASPKLLNTIQSLMNECGVIGNDNNRMILFLTYLSRKMNTSLHAIIQSDYNYLQSKMAELIPHEELIQISHLSDNALFYFAENELQNKLVLVEDTISNRKSLIPLLGFQNRGVVTKTTVQKNENLELETFQKHVHGNVSLSISTNDEQAFSKYAKQSFVLHEQTGPKQDEAILMYQRRQSAGLVTKHQENQFIHKLHNMQRVLQPISIVNPFAMELELPKQIINKQITNLHYLRFIEVITFLKQYQRTKKVNETTGEEYIETTLEDIKEANNLLCDILVNLSDNLNKPTRIFFEQLKEYVAKCGSSSFTPQEASRGMCIAKTTISRYMKTLVEQGYIQATGSGDRNHGFDYVIIDTMEYIRLNASVSSSIQTTLKSISGPQVDHTANGQPKTIKTSKLDQVDHKVEGAGIGATAGQRSEGTATNTTANEVEPNKNVA